MFNIIKALSILTLLSLSSNSFAEGQFFGYAAVTSDYRASGVSHSRGQPALQILAGYDFGNNFFVGTYFSNINYYAGDIEGEIETDVFAGYNFILSEDITLTSTLYQFAIQGAEKELSLDYIFFQLELNTAYGKLAAWYSLNDHFGDLSDDRAYWAAYTHSLPVWETGVYLDVNFGQYGAKESLGSNYWFYTLGVSGNIGPVIASLGYSGSDNDGKSLLGDVIANDGLYVKLVKWF